MDFRYFQFDTWNLVLDPASQYLYIVEQGYGGEAYERINWVGRWQKRLELIAGAVLADETVWIGAIGDLHAKKFAVLRCSIRVVQCYEVAEFRLEFPFQDEEEWDFSPNETNTSANLEVGEVLVFTIGDEAKCHTDQCTILDE